MTTEPMVLTLCGPPASGKGTQARLLGEQLDAPTLSTGRLIREQQRLGTDIGQLADRHLADGGLLPDLPTQQLLADWLDHGGHRRVVLDGFPRNVAQAGWLDRASTDRGLPPAIAVWLRVPDGVLIERTRRRWTCFHCGHSAVGPIENDPPLTCANCGAAMERRNDDQVAVLEKRLQAWHAAAPALQDHYRQDRRLIEIDADCDPAAVHRGIVAALGARDREADSADASDPTSRRPGGDEPPPPAAPAHGSRG